MYHQSSHNHQRREVTNKYVSQRKINSNGLYVNVGGGNSVTCLPSSTLWLVVIGKIVSVPTNYYIATINLIRANIMFVTHLTSRLVRAPYSIGLPGPVHKEEH